MQTPKSSPAFRRACSSTSAKGRSWLTQMVSDPYVTDALAFELVPGDNFGTLWVVSDPGFIHAYAVPLNRSCEPSYLGNVEQYFQNHSRRLVRGHRVGFWSWQACWVHQMRQWLRRQGLTVDCNMRITNRKKG